MCISSVCWEGSHCRLPNASFSLRLQLSGLFKIVVGYIFNEAPNSRSAIAQAARAYAGASGLRRSSRLAAGAAGAERKKDSDARAAPGVHAHATRSRATNVKKRGREVAGVGDEDNDDDDDDDDQVDGDDDDAAGESSSRRR